MLTSGKYFRVIVWEVEDRGSYGSGRCSSSRKDARIKDGNQYVPSGWFIRFLGPALKKLDLIEPKTLIEITEGGITQEPYYTDDGEKKYPKAPQIIVYDFRVLPKGGGSPAEKKEPRRSMDAPPVVRRPAGDEDDIPFGEWDEA